MIKVFVSQPMKDVDPDLIVYNFIRVRRRLAELLDDEVEVLDTYNHKHVPKTAGRIWHLGESIKKLDEADLVIFVKGYEKAKGCGVERKVCTTYGIPSFHESFIFDNKYFDDYEIKDKLLSRIKQGL